jgi:hypothetical protein
VDVAVSAAGEVSRLTRSSTTRPSPEQR